MTNESEAMEVLVERIARAMHPDVWAEELPVPTRRHTIAFHEGRAKSIAQAQAAARVIATALEARNARIAELKGALEDVCNPLRILQRHADEQGRQLNGMAYSIANNLAFVQQHARATLTKGDTTHD